MADPRYNDYSLPTTAPEITNDFLTDVRLEMVNSGASLRDANLAVQPGTFTHVIATACGNASYVTRSQQAVGRQDLTPGTCRSEVLEQWRIDLRLPDVSMSPSTGKILLKVSGSATVPNLREFALPNGLRGHVVGTWSGVTDGSEVDVITDDVGDATQLDGGTVVRFLNPPLNVSTEATVSFSSPLTGGADKETESRKRERVMNRLSYAMGGGGWGYLREIAFNALSQVTNCFVYPALGGPGSTKIVPVRGFDIARRVFTRKLDAAALGIVRNAIHAHSPDACQYVVSSCEDQLINVALTVTLPNASQSGGDGSGWADTLVWPPLAGDTRIYITAVTTSARVTISAATTVAPINGLTRIAWWSTTGREFVVRTIVATAAGSGTGAWDVTLDRPLIDGAGNTAAVNDYISPAASGIVEYGKTWVEVVGALGCGENTTVSDNRRKRHPFESSGPKSSLTMTELAAFKAEHPEISDAAWSYRSATTPTVPATVMDPPNAFVPNHFGIYPL